MTWFTGEGSNYITNEISFTSQSLDLGQKLKVNLIPLNR